MTGREIGSTVPAPWGQGFPAKARMRRIFMDTSDTSASGLYRAVLPIVHCRAELPGIELIGRKELRPGDVYDAYIFHRLPKDLDFIRGLKGKIIWELDDALDIIPSWNPSTRFVGQKEIDAVNRALDRADLIVAATEPLKKHLGREDKTYVAPNLVDLSLFPPRRAHAGTRVLWAGSRYHERDLEVLVDVVPRFPQLRWIFFGDCPKPLRKRVAFIEGGVPVQLYFRKLAEIAPDVAVCPLVDCLFNHCKSNLKYLEMAAAGATVVASNLPPYQGMDCVLVDNDWHAGIQAALARPARLPAQTWQNPTARQAWLNVFQAI